MRARLSVFIAVVQSILILTHLFLYETWVFFQPGMDSSTRFLLRIVLAVLCVSFVSASILAFRYSSSFICIFYTVSAAWLGFVNFLFLAACACWIVFGVSVIFGWSLDRVTLADSCVGLGVFAGSLGIFNAWWTRVRRITVNLPGLPESWRGRTAALVSDWHLGHVRNRGFLQRVLKILVRLQPDILFITGDLFDGTAVDFDRLMEPWASFSLPHGSYFIAGNHEQFSSPTKYFDAVKKAGIRLVDNEKIIVDGLQIVGAHYQDSMSQERLRSILIRANLDPKVASVLLVHSPDPMALGEQAGVSLQLCGHTHRGQFFPFTLIVSRIYGEYAYGLNRFGNLWVYTTCGAGTWGPPFRLGSSPEVVLIRFE